MTSIRTSALLAMLLAACGCGGGGSECAVDTDCPGGTLCDGGECVDDGSCISSCEGKECGDDGCGVSCGECSWELECIDNACEPRRCTAVSECPQYYFCNQQGRCESTGASPPSTGDGGSDPGAAGDIAACVSSSQSLGAACPKTAACYPCCDYEQQCIIYYCGAYLDQEYSTDPVCGRCIADANQCDKDHDCDDDTPNTPECSECQRQYNACLGL